LLLEQVQEGSRIQVGSQRYLLPASLAQVLWIQLEGEHHAHR
jgi:DtxR family Mn-dependent transcriptional regulator